MISEDRIKSLAQNMAEDRGVDYDSLNSIRRDILLNQAVRTLRR